MRKENLGEVLRKNAVTIMFVLLCIGGMAVSGQTPAYVVYELFGRLSRNAFQGYTANIASILQLRIIQFHFSISLFLFSDCFLFFRLA